MKKITILFNQDEKNKIDGVAVSIQKGKNVQWSQKNSPSFKKLLTENSTFCKPEQNKVTLENVEGIHVTSWDCIYFRVNSINDGSYDIVEWDHVVTYLNTDTSKEDENGFTMYRYQASDDFSLTSSDANVRASYDGTITISGDLYKLKETTDDIYVKIIISTPGRDDSGN